MNAASLRFHARHSWFNFQEQFSDLAAGIAGFLLFPFFIWIMSRVWERFNSYQGHYTYEEILLYIGATETLYMTFLRPAIYGRATADFSIALARPRSWLATSFSGFFGTCLGSRLVYLAIFVVTMPLLGTGVARTLEVAGRLLLFLPLLGVFQALIGLLFASAQVLWQETQYFALPVGKLFLVMGGVLGPIADFSEPFRGWLLALPGSDAFFQVGHFCVKGEFYQLTPLEWIARMLAACALLAVANFFFHRHARRHHQSYGG